MIFVWCSDGAETLGQAEICGASSHIFAMLYPFWESGSRTRKAHYDCACLHYTNCDSVCPYVARDRQYSRRVRLGRRGEKGRATEDVRE